MSHRKEEEREAGAAAVVMVTVMAERMMLMVTVMLRMTLIRVNHEVLSKCQAPSHSLRTYCPLFFFFGGGEVGGS